MWSTFQAKSKVSAGNIPALQLPVVYIVSPAQSSSNLATGHERAAEIGLTL